MIPASRGGKAKTLFQMVAITLFLLPITPEMTLLWWFRNAMMAIAVILTTLTGFDYVSKAYWTRSDSKSDKAARRAAAAAPIASGAGTSAGVPPVTQTVTMTGRRSRALTRDGWRRAGRPGGIGVADLIARLAADGATVATAESITGGRLVASLTSVPGSSAVVRGSVVAYATDVKTSMLGVDPVLLAELGAVCAEVAEQMAAGVRDRLRATYGVSTTGEAGPDSASGTARWGPCSSQWSGPQGTVDTPDRRGGRPRGDPGRGCRGRPAACWPSAGRRGRARAPARPGRH